MHNNIGTSELPAFEAGPHVQRKLQFWTLDMQKYSI